MAVHHSGVHTQRRLSTRLLTWHMRAGSIGSGTAGQLAPPRPVALQSPVTLPRQGLHYWCVPPTPPAMPQHYSPLPAPPIPPDYRRAGASCDTPGRNGQVICGPKGETHSAAAPPAAHRWDSGRSKGRQLPPPRHCPRRQLWARSPP